jgi:hypothetical protein
MNLFLRSLIVSVAFVAWSSSPAAAEPITWAFSGTMADGDPFNGFISFEVTEAVLDYPQTFHTVERSSFYRAVTDLRLRIGPDTFALETSPAHNTIDLRFAMTPPNPVGDALIIDADIVSRQFADALSLSVFLTFFDPSETWLTDGTMPPPLPNLATLSQKTLILRYQGPDSVVHDQTGQIESVRAVPEPATGLLVLAGLAACATRRRFNRTAG